MSVKEIAERIIALRDITQKTGFVTKRSQNDLLVRLDDKQLAEVALEIRRMENWNEPRQTTAR